MPKYVYPQASCAVGWDGRIISLSPQQVWDGDDPFVKARPEFFADTPAGAVVHRTAPVEQATAAPGEKKTRRG